MHVTAHQNQLPSPPREREPAKLWHFEMIDSMTDEAFKGNPTPVFILDGANQGFETQKWPRDHILQTVAREMDQSETIFVTRDSSDDESGGDAARWLVRSFTPYKEEVLCGHGLVGAAYLLGRSGGHAHGRRIRFRTVGGLLIDAQVDAREPSCGAEYGEAIQIQLELPAQPVKDWFSEDEELKREIARSLGVKMEQILALGRNALMDLVIELSCDVNFSAAGMKIDAVALMEACPLGTRSQILTSGGERYGVDFVKRVFAYGSEDQGTGSTYCVLMPYWHAKLSRSSMTARQVSERTAVATVCDSAKREGYMTLGSSAVKVMEGKILVPDGLH